MWARIILSLLLLGACKPRTNQSEILETYPTISTSDAPRVAKLAGQTMFKVEVFQSTASLLRPRGFELAAFGGTAKELVEHVLKSSAKMGGLDAYETWLNATSSIHLFDFHRAMSDLDLMLIPRNPAQQKSAIDTRIQNEITEELNKGLPGNVFYKDLDIYFPQEFFVEKYPLRMDHLQATSNLVIGEHGLLDEIEYLDIEIGGEKINVARLGLEQIITGQYDFRLADAFGTNMEFRNDNYRHLRQYLRWVRELSENPNAQLSSRSKTAMDSLFKFLISKEQIAKTLENIQKEKILEAIEKMQLYSRNSLYTEKLMNDFGVRDLLERTGKAEVYLLDALHERTELDKQNLAKKTGSMTRAGDLVKSRPITLHHWTKAAAAQNISQGALWKSNNQSMIGSQTSTSALTDSAIYAAEKYDSAHYGEFAVTIEIDPNAVEGVDFVKSGSYWAIRTRECIAQDADGKLKISELNFSSLYPQLLDQLKSDLKNTYLIIDSLGALLYPAESKIDQDRLYEVLRITKDDSHRRAFLRSVFTKQGVVSKILNSENKMLIRTLNSWLNHFGLRDGDLVTQFLESEKTFDNLDAKTQQAARAKVEEALKTPDGGCGACDVPYFTNNLAAQWYPKPLRKIYLDVINSRKEAYALRFNLHRQFDQALVAEILNAPNKGDSHLNTLNLLLESGEMGIKKVVEFLGGLRSREQALIWFELSEDWSAKDALNYARHKDPQLDQRVLYWQQKVKLEPKTLQSQSFDLKNPEAVKSLKWQMDGYNWTQLEKQISGFKPLPEEFKGDSKLGAFVRIFDNQPDDFIAAFPREGRLIVRLAVKTDGEIFGVFIRENLSTTSPSVASATIRMYLEEYVLYGDPDELADLINEFEPWREEVTALCYSARRDRDFKEILGIASDPRYADARIWRKLIAAHPEWTDNKNINPKKSTGKVPCERVQAATSNISL